MSGRSIKPLAAALAAAVALVATPRPAAAEIGSYIVVDIDTDEVLAAKDPFQPWYPASLTKLMTAYVIFKQLEAGTLKPTSPVRITPHARSQPPTKMGFRVGTVITIDTALKIILTKSANDVTAALSEAVGGTERNFVRMMNQAAADLGMTQTSYANPHGLPNRRQITSARDIAILVDALKEEFPQYAHLFKLSGFRLGKRAYRNHNALLRQYPGTNGMKTGFICSSGFNLAASAERDGHHLAAIVLGGYNGRHRNERTAEYLEMAFRELAARESDEPQGENLYEMVSPLPEDTPPVDLRPVICGAKKATTAYDNGTVSEAVGLAVRARIARAERARQRDVLEAAIAEGSVAAADPDTLPRGGTASPPVLASASQAIAANMGVGWERLPPDVTAYAPTDGDVTAALSLPSMQQTLVEAELAAVPAAETEEPVVVKPITYLSSNRAGPVVTISLGGADETRPDPLSGTIVGGGPAPKPRPRPVAVAMLKTGEAIDPEIVVDIAEEVLASAEAGAADADPPEATREAAAGDSTPEDADVAPDADAVAETADPADAVPAAEPASAADTAAPEEPVRFARFADGKPLPAPRPAR